MSRSIIKYLEEGRFLGTTAAVLSGLGGSLTGGSLGGYYHAKKGEVAQKELNRRDGKLDLYKDDNTGGNYWHTLGGAVPILGAITNGIAANKHYDLKDELDTKKVKK